MMKRILALFLSCLMVLPLAACAGEGEKPAADTTTAAPDTTDPEETTDDFYIDRNNAKDSLPDKMNFNDADIRIINRMSSSGFAGILDIEFFTDSENSTNVVADAIIRRNAVVEDRLGVKMVVISTSESIGDKLRTSVMSFSDDYDIYASSNGASFMSEGLLLDMSGVDYLDLKKPWWSASYLDAVTFDDRFFAITGELAVSFCANTFVTFFNKPLWQDYHGDEDLYQIVRDGEFTLDKFSTLCSTLYKDLNGDGIANVDDQYGNIRPWETGTSDSFVAGSHLNYYTYDDENECFYFTFGSDRDMKFVEKMRQIWFRNNSTYTSENNEMNYDTDLMAKLKNDTALFTVAKMSCAELLRDMDSDFGIVPVPKFDEEQEEYSTLLERGFTTFGIVNTAPDPDMVGAFLEAACAENYRYVTPAYYDSAVKYGYTRDVESAEMLDICVAGVYINVEQALGLGGQDIIACKCNTEKAMDRLTSFIAKQIKEWEKTTNEVIDAIRDLA